MSAEAVLSGKTLPTREFCEVLINEVKIKHARLYHPFYLDLYEGKLSLDAVKIWAKEAWGIFAYNVAINTAKLVRCQLSGIHDPEIHKKFVDIIHSEVGYTYFEVRRARYWDIERFFFASAKASAYPAKELERCEIEEDFLPTTVLARVGWLDIALRSNHILEQVASTNCCNEFSNQLTGGKVFQSVQRSLRIEAARYRIFRRARRSGHRAQQYRL